MIVVLFVYTNTSLLTASKAIYHQAFYRKTMIEKLCLMLVVTLTKEAIIL